MKKLFAAAAGIALLVSCAPPFDLAYSSAAVILSKMTKESQLGPLNNYSTGSYSSTPAFYPEKTASGVDASRGFYYMTDPGNSQEFLGFVQPDGLGGYSSFVSAPGSLYHQDPNYPAAVAVPVKAGDFTSLTSFDSTNPSNTALAVVQAVVATTSDTLIYGLSFSALGGYGTAPVAAIGVSVSPSAAATDTLYFLIRDSGGKFWEGLATMSSTGVIATSFAYVVPSPPETLDFLAAGAVRVLYYHDPTSGASYASFNAGGSWQCWKWWVDALGVFHETQLTGVVSRIDALLTTGELFSTQGGIGRVYDSNGNVAASFPMGNLQLAYEEYVSGTPRVFFSLPIVTGDKHVSFAVYSIATSQIDSLKY